MTAAEAIAVMALTLLLVVARSHGLNEGLAALAGALLVVTRIIVGAPLSESALQQIQALQEEKLSRTPAQQKMDSQLVYALKLSLNQVIAPGVTNLRTSVHPNVEGLVKVDITATVTPGLISFIESSGGAIINSFAEFQAIRALIPLPLAETLAAGVSEEITR